MPGVSAAPRGRASARAPVRAAAPAPARAPSRRARSRPPASTYQRIYDVVRRIPRACVATYGQVAALAGLGGHARQVGYALHALPAQTLVPWQRVVNARGAVSLGPRGGGDVTQRLMLEREGIRFDAAGRVSLAEQGWKPAGARHRARSTRPAAVSFPRRSRQK